MLGQFDNLNEAEEIEETDEETTEETTEETEETDVEEKETEEEKPWNSTAKKFTGKTKEDVIKSYSEVEKKLHEQAERLAALEKRSEEATSKQEVQEIKKEFAEVEKEILDEIEKADYTDMGPKDYGKFIIERVKKMTEAIAEKKASETFSRETSFTEKIKKEVEEVKKDYEIMRDTTERGDAFREIVLDLITASRQRGQQITLKQAVEKALRIAGEQPAEKPIIKKPKPIEKTQPSTAGENASEEDIVKDGMKRAGGGGYLGGL